MKLKSVNRTTISLIGVGIGFIFLPVLIDLYTSHPFIQVLNKGSVNPLTQLLNTISVGIVYICIGLAIGGWHQRTQSKQIPFWVIGSTAGVAILIIIGLELFVLQLSVVSTFESSHVDFGVVEQLVLSLHFLLGWTVVLLIVADSAPTPHHWLFPIVGIAVVPLAVTAVSIHTAYVFADQRGYSGMGGAGFALQFAFPYSFIILVIAGIYTFPYLICRNKI